MTNSETTSSAPEVAPPDGYSASTDSMSSAGRTIHDAADDAMSEVKDLSPTELSGEEFGTGHAEYHGDYAAAIEQFGTAAQSMCTNIMSFASQIGASGGAYAATETANTNTVNQSGGGF